MLNVYEAMIMFNDGEEDYIVDWAIVYAHDEKEAVKILVDDDPCETRHLEWIGARVNMIAWATGDPSPSIIVMSDCEEVEASEDESD